MRFRPPSPHPFARPARGISWRDTFVVSTCRAQATSSSDYYSDRSPPTPAAAVEDVSAGRRGSRRLNPTYRLRLQVAMGLPPAPCRSSTGWMPVLVANAEDLGVRQIEGHRRTRVGPGHAPVLGPFEPDRAEERHLRSGLVLRRWVHEVPTVNGGRRMAFHWVGPSTLEVACTPALRVHGDECRSGSRSSRHRSAGLYPGLEIASGR